MVARLGPKGFQTPMWDFNVMLISIHSASPTTESSFAGLDVSEQANAIAKDEALRTTEIKQVKQKEAVGDPDARIVMTSLKNKTQLSEYADAYQGISPADFPKFGRFFWEKYDIDKQWWFWQSTVNSTIHYGGKSLILWYSELEKKIHEEGTAYIPRKRSMG